MCSHFGHYLPTEFFPEGLPDNLSTGAWPKMQVPVLLLGPAGKIVGKFMRWGLIPNWASDTKKLGSTFNARGETIHEKPTFKPSFLSGKRCVIPARFFCENTYLPGTRKKTGEVQISLRSGDPMYIAGLWALNTRLEPQPIRSCTMVTTTANSTIEPYHHRMPVILEQKQISLWLQNDTPLGDLQSLIYPCAAEALQVRGAPEEGSLGLFLEEEPTK